MLPFIFYIYFGRMLTTKNIILNYTDVPETWIFEHYCKLNRKLTGQDEKIKSMFNVKDSIPSMCIYFNKETGVYKFKDFSTGISGSAVDLVKAVHNISFRDATLRIINDYQNYLKNNDYTLEEIKYQTRYKVISYNVRDWNILDRDFWVRYNIGSSILNKYNVRAIEDYTMEKIDDCGTVHSITISGNHIYGYFKSDGSLYKIYQPKNKKKKFIKVKPYIQGSEQLENNSKLLICSSLKDIMSIKSLKLKIDCVAPDSENTMINKTEMFNYIETYNGNVSVLFDNDDAGIEAMKKYKEMYNTNIFILPLSKDPSDSIKEHGVNKVLYTLVPLLQRSYERVSL